MDNFKYPYQIDGHRVRLMIYALYSIHCFYPCCYYFDVIDVDDYCLHDVDEDVDVGSFVVVVDGKFHSFDFDDYDDGTHYDHPY